MPPRHDRPGDTSPTHARVTWHSLNRPTAVSPQWVRLACGFLLVAYGAVAVVRYDPAHPVVGALRGAVCAWAARGFAVGARFRWNVNRAYCVGLAFLLPTVSAIATGSLGNHGADLPLLALATFVPMVFLPSARDIVATGLAVGVVQMAVLRAYPSVDVPATTMAIVIDGTIVCGAAVGFMLVFYRSSLQDSLARLERALHAKSDFLNTMSHELRSPLHVIIGYADVLHDGDAGLGNDFIAERIRTSALELLQLVENTMNVARLDAGRVRLQLEEFAPAGALHEVADGIRALPEAQTGVPVEWSVAPDLPSVRLDRLKLKEVVQNLVSNALKFTAAGSVRVRAEREGDRLRIAVTDTGVGVPREAQDRIFEVFERVEPPDGHRPGVGLGLYIVKNLTQLMGGTIELASRPGVGSCFTVRLPLRVEDAAAAPPPDPARPGLRPAA
jgi:signal transduction histidine kinase